MEILSSDLEPVHAYFFECTPNESANNTEAAKPNAAVGQEFTKSFQIPEQSLQDQAYDSRRKTDPQQHDLYTKDGPVIR
jgi:hypothetical protein